MTDYIGLRVARWRDTAGLTQQQLADRIGRSREYISRLENGRRPVTDRRDLYALATALGVPVERLTGQGDQPRTRDEIAMLNAIPALRGALDDDPDGPATLDPDALADAVDRAMAARMACDYRTLTGLLPAVIADTRRLANTGSTEEERRQGLTCFVKAAAAAAFTIKPFGYIDLGTRLAERALAAAEELGDPVDLAATRFVTAQLALASGTVGGRRRSYATAATAAEQLGDSHDDDGALTWYGMLHLHAAMSAASLGHGDDTGQHLAEAEAAAGRVSSDPWRMELTPSNVGVWRVGIALEAGEPDRAPVEARRVDRTGLRTRQRLSRLHMDTGRGLYLAGRPDAAVRQFLAADEVAPAELRTRPSVREIVGQMVRDARRQGSSELRELAVRVGVDPLDPDIGVAG